MKKYKIVVTVLVCIIMVLTTGAVPAAISFESDETIYVKIASDGDIESIDMVTKVSGADDVYTIYGELADIKTLTEGAVYKQEEEKIIWDLSGTKGDFYFQGKITKPLPINIKITHYLNGQTVSPEEIVGKAGRYAVKINVDDNPEAEAAQKGRYLVQIQIQVDSSKMKNINAQEAFAITTGKFIQLVWTVMPGESGEVLLEYDTETLETGNITITLAEYQTAIPKDFLILAENIGTMGESLIEVADGTESIYFGLIETETGAKKLYNGMKDLETGSKELKDGFDLYKSGLTDYVNGIGIISENLTGAVEGINNINAGVDRSLYGYEEINGGYSDTTAGLEQLLYLAQELAEGGDSNAVHLAEGLQEAVGALQQINDNFSQANKGLALVNEGLTDANSGLSMLSKGLDSITEKNTKILNGYTELIDGYDRINRAIEASANGIMESENGMKGLSQGLYPIAEAQKIMADGLIKISEGIDDGINNESSIPVSFMDKRNTVESVQFIIVIDGITLSGIDEIEHEETTTKGLALFWERLKALFKNII